jgi:hypothetical protein
MCDTLGPDFLQALGDDDPRRSLDQREMGERLGEVAQMPPGAGVQLLGI